MDAAIKFPDLQSSIRGTNAPLVIDVRRTPAFKASTELIAGALRRDPEQVASWAQELPPSATAVVYCVHGHEVSQGVAKALNAHGIAARYLEGGIEEGWKTAGGALDRKPAGASTRWVTRERPKIDRIACPWLVSRFLDREAEFLYVPSATVLQTAKERDAMPYDVPSVTFSHEGELMPMPDECPVEHDPLRSGRGAQRVQLRRVHQALPAARSGARSARRDRSRCRHGEARSRAAGRRASRNLARPVAHVLGRPRDAQARNGGIRRALRMVQGGTGRSA